MVRSNLAFAAAMLAFELGAGGAQAAPPPSSLTQPFDMSFTFVPAPAKSRPQVSRFADAPVPNSDRGVPTLRALGPAQAEFSPGLFNAKHTYRGEGFTVGSTAQDEQQKHFKPTPGVNLSVPLE